MTGRQRVAQYGPRGLRVAVFAWTDELGPLISVEWYHQQMRQRRSWRPDSRENRRQAKAWAQAFAEERLRLGRSAVPTLTLRQLWERWQQHNWNALAPKTRLRYADNWRAFEAFAGRHLVAEYVTRELIHDYRLSLEKSGLGIRSVRDHIGLCKNVFNWAEAEELIQVNKWRTYRLRIGRGQLPKSPPEYTAQEIAALLAVLDPTKATQWRPWVALTILAAQGVRQASALPLTWGDLALGARLIRWPKETDKNRRGLEQPLRRPTVQALRVARDWARREEVRSDFVIYGPAIPPAKKGGPRAAGEKPYTIQSFWKALTEAEKRAGVEHRSYRAGHGFRRTLVGDLAALTGDTMLALRAVGDRDPRRAEDYRKDRAEEFREAFRALDRRASTRTAPAGSEKSDEPAEQGNAEGVADV